MRKYFLMLHLFSSIITVFKIFVVQENTGLNNDILRWYNSVATTSGYFYSLVNQHIIMTMHGCGKQLITCYLQKQALFIKADLMLYRLNRRLYTYQPLC